MQKMINRRQTEKLNTLLAAYLSFVSLVLEFTLINKMGKEAVISSTHSKAVYNLSDLKNKPAVNAANAAKQKE